MVTNKTHLPDGIATFTGSRESVRGLSAGLTGAIGERLGKVYVVENKPGIKHEHRPIEGSTFDAICILTCPTCGHYQLSVCSCIADDKLYHLCVAPKGESVKLVIRSGGVIIGDL